MNAKSYEQPDLFRRCPSRELALDGARPASYVAVSSPCNFLLSPAHVRHREEGCLRCSSLSGPPPADPVRPSSPPRARSSSPVRPARPGTPSGVRVADLAGDLPAVFGLGADPDVGLADWLDAGVEAPTEALDRLLTEVAPGVALLPRGRGPRVPTVLPAPETGAALGVALGSRILAGARRLRHGARARHPGGGGGRRRRRRRAAGVLPRAAPCRARTAARAHRRSRPARRARSIARCAGDQRGARPAGPRTGPGEGGDRPGGRRRGAPHPAPEPLARAAVEVVRRIGVLGRQGEAA